jgi:hypothetical protein
VDACAALRGFLAASAASFFYEGFPRHVFMPVVFGADRTVRTGRKGDNVPPR